jgi:hypothetical protein
MASLPSMAAATPKPRATFPAITSASGVGAPAGPAAGPGSPAFPGLITGRVLGLNQAPLSGACVTVSAVSGAAAGPAPLPGPAAAGLRATGQLPAVTTRTGTDGRFVITGLRPGRYTVAYRDCSAAGGYFPLWYPDATLASGAARVLVTAGQRTLLRPVTLRPTSPMAMVRASMAYQRKLAGQAAASPAGPAAAASTKFGVISGAVTGPKGNKLSDICVIGTTGSGDSTYAIATITTNGSYQLTFLIPGSYQVLFLNGCGNTGNFAPQWWKHSLTVTGQTLVKITTGAKVSGINAALATGASISGTVRFQSKTGPTLSGICAIATGEGGVLGIQTETSTDASGNYKITSLGTGKYQMDFFPGDCGNVGNFLPATLAKPVSAQDGKTTTHVDAVLQAGGIIRGVVTDTAGTPLNGICVTIDGTTAGVETITGLDGSYEVNQLPKDSYSVAFAGGCDAIGGPAASYAPQVYNGQVNDAAATLVVISKFGQVVPGINARMRPGGEVSGEVTDTAGDRLSNVCVGLTTPEFDAGLGQGPLAQAELLVGFGAVTSAFNGGYEFDNLPPGQYQAEFFNCAEPDIFASQWFHGRPGQPASDLISVRAGVRTTGVDAVLALSGSISGVVTGKNGAKLTGVCVTTTNLSDHTQDEAQATLLSPFTSGGSYTVTGLPAGTYAVQFTSCEGQPYASQWYHASASLAKATAVKVTSGKTTKNINAALTAGGSVSGKVTVAATGKARANVCVLASDAADGSSGVAITSASGGYTISHLAAGSYTVDYFSCVADSGGLADQARTGVTVAGGKATTGVNAALGVSGTISGTVRSGSQAAAEPGICVEASPKTGHGVSEFGISGPSGAYAVEGLAPGSYRLLFTPVCVVGTASLVPQWFNGQQAEAAATPVTVTAGKTRSGVNATLTADGSIAGTVTSATPGGPDLTGICVRAVPAGGAGQPVIAISGNGGYQASGLAPGSYQVEFSSGCGITGYATQWFNGQSAQGSATTVTVTQGAVTPGISAVMKP